MIAALRAIAGAAGVREGTDADRVHGIAPAAFVAPRDTAECAAVLAACSERGWTVEVAGARTASRHGLPVDQVDVLLSTTRLTGIVEYEPDDLTIGVAGGTTLAELRARVEPNRQRVPLDAPTASATVGGVLARAAAGPMRRSWATPRRQTLGIELVTGDGRVLRVGGRVVKNVAGYDLNKLIVGSAGTLGVITRAHLRLLPQPVAAADLSITGADRAALVAVARALLSAAVQPAALELTGPEWRLIARYEGATELIEAAVQLASRMAGETGGRLSRDSEALPALNAREADASIAVRLSDLPTHLERTLEQGATLAAPDGLVAAHAGDGIVRVLLPAERASSPAAVAELARAVEAARTTCGGAVIVERGPAELMRALDPWGPVAEPVLRLTRELKRQFDPAGILQRGRWMA